MYLKTAVNPPPFSKGSTYSPQVQESMAGGRMDALLLCVGLLSWGTALRQSKKFQ